MMPCLISLDVFVFKFLHYTLHAEVLKKFSSKTEFFETVFLSMLTMISELSCTGVYRKLRDTTIQHNQQVREWYKKFFCFQVIFYTHIYTARNYEKRNLITISLATWSGSSLFKSISNWRASLSLCLSLLFLGSSTRSWSCIWSLLSSWTMSTRKAVSSKKVCFRSSWIRYLERK